MGYHSPEMRTRRTPNPKRRIQPDLTTAEAQARLEDFAKRVSYGGNPEHKRNPGDFGLQPPSYPRQGKSLCDEVAIFTRAEALGLLRQGLRRGLISVQVRQGWPQNVWAVAPNDTPMEAMLENPAIGAYHGYPMLEDDPLAEEVLERWRGQ
jgi:hypothetical protein